MKQYRAPVPVVIVGNITVGGTGKTPVVIALVEMLASKGIRAGVVSRGFGRSVAAVRLVGDGSRVRDVGDEPLLIYRRTGCPCAVHKDRGKAARALLDNFALDVLLADDGLQHYAFARDLEVVMYDAAMAFGNGRCLPVGPLREPLSRLASADLVLARGGGSPDDVGIEVQCLVNLATGEERACLPSAVGAEIVAVAGIAQPGQFFTQLRNAGFNVTPFAFRDHHEFCAADFAALQGRVIIMTQKDAVKCADLVGDNVWYVKINALLPQVLTDAVLQLF
ncbi:MAG: tetraacyldisaccharide 4'-kinase [Halioglobus sp.]